MQVVCRAIAQQLSCWPTACYESVEHDDLPLDIEYPILSCNCKDLQSTMRAQSYAPCSQTCWCVPCDERAEHGDEPPHVHDPDSASDESEQKDDDVLPMGSASLNSWNVMHSPSDAHTWHGIEDERSSNSSFMLSYAVVVEDAPSACSFTLVGGITPTAATEDVVDTSCTLTAEYGASVWLEQQQQQLDE